MQAVHACNGWGLSGERRFSDEPGESLKVDYPIKNFADIEKLQVPRHAIDEEKTSKNVQQLSEAIGDIITINVDRGPDNRMWAGDPFTDLGYLRGIENFMWDLVDNTYNARMANTGG